MMRVATVVAASTAFAVTLAPGAAQAAPKTVFVAVGGVDGASCGASAATACRTITRAIALAAGGDTVSVGPGRFDVEGAGERTRGIVIDKQLTLLGAQAGVDPRPADPLDPRSPSPRSVDSGLETVIVDSDTSITSKSTGLFDARTVSNVTVDGFTFAGNDIGAGLFVGQKGVSSGGRTNFGGYTVLNNIFVTSMTGLYIDNSGAPSRVRHNVFGDLGPAPAGASNGSGFYSSESQSITFEENYFHNNARAGVADARTWGINPATGRPGVVPGIPAVSHDFAFTGNVSRAGSGPVFASIDGLRITDNTIETGGSTGIQLSGDSLDDVQILRNTISGMRTYGINLTQAVPRGLENGTVEIGRNTILDTRDPTAPGVGIRIGAEGAGGPLTIAYNRIVGNGGGGLQNADPDAQVDARRNWWGCNAGPIPGLDPGCDHATAPAGGAQPAFTPWLTLSLAAVPPVLYAGDRSTLTAAVDNLSDGTTAAGPFFLTGEAIFGSTPAGAHDPQTVPLDDADVHASSAYRAGADDPDELRTTVDNQTVRILIQRPARPDVVPTVDVLPTPPPAPPAPPTPLTPGQRAEIVATLVNRGNAPARRVRACLRFSHRLQRSGDACRVIARLRPGHTRTFRLAVRVPVDACAGPLRTQLRMRVDGRGARVDHARSRLLAGPCRPQPCPTIARSRPAAGAAATRRAGRHDTSDPSRARARAAC